ncbi:MAG: gamma carbonic anhydrase family protein [Myxococcales bacterium]
MAVRAYRGVSPTIHPTAFVEESAQLIGDVHLGERSSVWFNTVIRGDVHRIRIGAETNVQDLCCLHVLKDRFALTIGDRVTVGHHVTLHGCTVGELCLIGMGAIVMDGAEIGRECIIGAGSLVAPGTIIPPGMLAFGSPAKVRRPLTDAEKAHLRTSASNYVAYAESYR